MYALQDISSYYKIKIDKTKHITNPAKMQIK